MESVIELIKKVRNIRAEMNIKTGDQRAVPCRRKCRNRKESFARMKLRSKSLHVLITSFSAISLDVPKASAKAVLTAVPKLPSARRADRFRQRTRTAPKPDRKLDAELQRLNGQLSNVNFVERAPAEKVQELRDRGMELEGQVETLNENLASLN